MNPEEVDGPRLRSALRSLGLLLNSEWSNRALNLWTVELDTFSVTKGVAIVPSLPADVIAVLGGYITPSGLPDRVISPISRAEYDSLPNKTTQGPPTSFYFDRVLAPSVTLWPVPDATYTVSLRLWRPVQDAGLAGQSAAIPTRFLEACIAGLAAKLAVKFSPSRMAALQVMADATWLEASREDRERVPLRLVPGGAYRW